MASKVIGGAEADEGIDNVVEGWVKRHLAFSDMEPSLFARVMA